MRGPQLLVSVLRRAGVDAGREQLRVRVLHRRLRELLQVVAQAGVQRELATAAAIRPATKNEYSWMSGLVVGARRARTAERLDVGLAGASRAAGLERREVLKVYEPEKLPGKKLRMSSNWKSKPPFSLCAPRTHVTVSATCQRLIVVSRGLKKLRPMVSTRVVP